MKKTERIISSILLVIISLSNVATPVSYAAETVATSASQSAPAKPSTTPAPRPKFHQPDTGSVLGASTSLLEIGTQTFGEEQGTVGSANKNMPIRMQQLEKKVYQTNENVTLAVTNPDNDPFSTAVVDSNGKPAAVPITETSSGTTTNVEISGSNEITPGKYTIKLTDNEGNVTTQDFSWGVLALNTDKSMYHPGETANISLAVLNDKGDMVCDAKLDLHITFAAAGISDTLSTSASDSAKKIVENPQCQLHDYSLTPDYQAKYTFEKAGTYTVDLTGTTSNGTHKITSTIPVTNQIPFDVQRVSATRIYPPNTYPMTINIKANRDFSGTVTETVPQDFTITPATMSAVPVSSYTNMQTVYLDTINPAAQLQQAIAASSSGGLVMPFHGNYPITQGFGAQLTDPTLQAFYTQYGLAGHDGIDFGVPMNTPLYAVDDGNIIWSGPGDYGTTIIIQHGWGESYYGHLSTTAVNVGAHVLKGQLIGYSGESGEATGPHLHFGMKPLNPDRTNGYYGKVDPMVYLPYNNQQVQSLSSLPGFGLSNVLSASTSAADPNMSASDSATVTPTIVPTDTPSASPSAAPSVTAPQQPAVTAVPTQASQETTSITTTTTPPDNTNFTVLNKQILLSEQLSNNSQTEKVKVLTWNVTLKKGETTSIGYDYQAPRVSPQFYLMGPVQFYQKGSGKVVFQEQRQWEIASDDVGVDWYSNTTGNPFNGYSWQYRKKITIDHTKVNAAVAYDNTGPSSSGASVLSASSLSWNHTISGYNTALLVSIAVGSASDGGCVVTVTDNGTSMGAALKTAHTANTNAGFLSVYGLLNAPVGTNSIAVSVSSCAGGTPGSITGGSESFLNAGGFGTPKSNTDTTGAQTATPTITTTGSTSGNIIAGFVADGSGINSATAPSTSVFIDDATGSNGAGNLAGAISSSTGSNVTMAWSASTTDFWAVVAIEVQTSNSLANFPTLVSLSSDSDLSSKAQLSGNDILFTDSTGKTLLNYQIESYSSGTLNAWVQIPSLSTTTDTILYMYYGNPSASSQQNATTVWSGYNSVWHLDEATATSTITDSEGNNNGTKTNANLPSQSSSGIVFDSQSYAAGTPLDTIDVPTSSTDNFTTNSFSYSFWLNTSTHFGTADTPIYKGGASSSDPGYDVEKSTSGPAIRAHLVDGTTSATATLSSGSLLEDSTWHYFVVVVDRNSQTMIPYLDGVKGTAVSISGIGSVTTTKDLQLGRNNSSFKYKGLLDEVRVAPSTLSSGWISTEYNNEHAPGPGGFISSVGNAETSIYAPTLSQVLRHGQFFNTQGAIQPFVF